MSGRVCWCAPRVTFCKYGCVYLVGSLETVDQPDIWEVGSLPLLLLRGGHEAVSLHVPIMQQ